MARIVVAEHAPRPPFHERLVSLLEWLDGQWAIAMSHPEDFAPCPTTPIGFKNSLADAVLAQQIRPIAVTRSVEPPPPCWLDHAVNDDAVVMLDRSRSLFLNLAERALAARIAALDGPFALILDDRGRCRATLRYDAHSLRERSCTLQGLADIANSLRQTSTHDSTSGELLPA